MNIKIYDLRHWFRGVPLSSLDRFCRAHSSQHLVGSTACGCAAMWRVVGGGGGITLAPQTPLLSEEESTRNHHSDCSSLPPVTLAVHGATWCRLANGHIVLVSISGLTPWAKS